MEPTEDDATGNRHSGEIKRKSAIRKSKLVTRKSELNTKNQPEENKVTDT